MASTQDCTNKAPSWAFSVLVLREYKLPYSTMTVADAIASNKMAMTISISVNPEGRMNPVVFMVKAP